MNRRFISPRHQESDPISPAIKCLFGLPMPITRRLDDMFVEKGNLAKMVFQHARVPPDFGRLAVLACGATD
jgi:hypothetical protein